MGERGRVVGASVSEKGRAPLCVRGLAAGRQPPPAPDTAQSMRGLACPACRGRESRPPALAPPKTLFAFPLAWVSWPTTHRAQRPPRPEPQHARRGSRRGLRPGRGHVQAGQGRGGGGGRADGGGRAGGRGARGRRAWRSEARWPEAGSSCGQSGGPHGGVLGARGGAAGEAADTPVFWRSVFWRARGVDASVHRCPPTNPPASFCVFSVHGRQQARTARALHKTFILTPRRASLSASAHATKLPRARGPASAPSQWQQPPPPPTTPAAARARPPRRGG